MNSISLGKYPKSKVLAELGIKTTLVSRVLILGGSRIGEFVATDLSVRG